MQFRLTFNKPANKIFFEGEDAKGIRIRVQDGVVMFKPTQSVDGPDVAPLEARNSRGGIEVTIEGSQAENLLSYFKNPDGNPFFLLRKEQKGWFAAVRHDGPKWEPPRFHPQVRVWLDNKMRPMSSQLVSNFQGMGVSQFLEEVRNAKSVIEKHEAEKKPGRPPKEVTDARDTLRLFSEAAREVLPLDELRKAFVIIGKFLGDDPSKLMSLLTAPTPGTDDEIENDFAEVETKAAQPTRKNETRASAPKQETHKSEPTGKTTGTKGRKIVKGHTRADTDPVTERLASDAAAKLGLHSNDDLEVPVNTSRRRRLQRQKEHA